MKKQRVSLFVLATLLFALVAWGQSAGSAGNSAQSSAQTGTSSGTSGSMASQAGSQAASGGSDTEQMMEGCIVREQQDYYLEPINGQEVHLNGPDVAQHVNHHVRIHGNEQPSQSASSGSTGTMAGSSSASNSSNPPEFLVTRVDMVSDSCPANLQHRNPSGSQGPGNTHEDESGPKRSSL